MGIVETKIDVPSHAQLLASSKDWRKKHRAVLRKLDGSPPLPQKRPKKKKYRIPIQIGKRVEGLRYKDYMKSKEWRKRRTMYFAKFGNKCVVCKGSRNVGLHHLSYERLGGELDEDLVALCWHCHYKYHEKHGVKRESKETTYRFIQDEQETEELRLLRKNL